MNKLKASTVFFIGAGASAPIGFPTTRTAMERVGLDPYDEAIIKNVTSHGDLLQNIYSSQSYERKDLEGILEYLRQTNWVLTLSDSLEKEVERAIQAFDAKTIKFVGSSHLEEGDILTLKRSYVDLIKSAFKHYESSIDLLERDIKKYLFDLYRYIPNRHNHGVTTYYKPLMEIKDYLFGEGDCDIPIFTTNYDLVIEQLAALDIIKDCKLINGFALEEKSGQNVFSLHQFKETFTHPVVKLFKLHGGLDWAIRKEDDKLIRIVGVESAIEDEKYSAPVIVPPGEHGQVYSRPEFFKLQDCFKKYLLDAERCIVIGFSFRDTGRINRVFRDALGRNKELRIIISSRTEKLEDFKKKVSSDFRGTINKFEERVIYLGGGFKNLPEQLKELKKTKI